MTFFLFFIFYNICGDCMKKYFWSIFFSIIVGIYLGKFTLKQYSDLSVFPVSYNGDIVYFLQYGVYSDEDIMRESMNSFGYYIYDSDDDGFHTYIGITKSLENANKVKEYFKNKGYDIYVKENSISNGVFISVLSQYDLLLNDASGDAISDICNQILSSYEELVINENDGDSKE